jgi:hypothetical protein
MPKGLMKLLMEIEHLVDLGIDGTGLEKRDDGRKGSAALTMRHPSILKKLALNSPTSGGRSVGIVCSRTESTELVS